MRESERRGGGGFDLNGHLPRLGALVAVDDCDKLQLTDLKKTNELPDVERGNGPTAGTAVDEKTAVHRPHRVGAVE